MGQKFLPHPKRMAAPRTTHAKFSVEIYFIAFSCQQQQLDRQPPQQQQLTTTTTTRRTISQKSGTPYKVTRNGVHDKSSRFPFPVANATHKQTARRRVRTVPLVQFAQLLAFEAVSEVQTSFNWFLFSWNPFQLKLI